MSLLQDPLLYTYLGVSGIEGPLGVVVEAGSCDMMSTHGELTM